MLRPVALLVLVLALAACGGEEEPGAADRADPPSQLTGLIVEVDGSGSDIRSFALESGGERYEILIAADVDYGFDLAHLREHERDGEPVHCRLEDRNGLLYALTIEDV